MLLTGMPLPVVPVVPVACATTLTGSVYKVVRAFEAATFPAGETEFASLLLPSGAKLCPCAGILVIAKVFASLPLDSP
jgi:hypothetical protein